MIITHIRTRFADAFFPRLMEWQAAVVTLFGGLLMLANPDLFSRSPDSYRVMEAWATQSQWGYFACTIAIVRLVILFVNGAWRRSPHARAMAAFITCFMWWTLTMSYLPVMGWGLVLAGGMLGGDLLNIMRTMRDARVVDDEYRGR